ncbi:MAG: Ig-like domain-containing protein, partial [Chloroflexota bacterium]
LQVSTVGFLEVSQVIPADGTDEVQTDGAITVMFNRPVVPLVSSSQQSTLPQPVEFSPPVEGKGRWISTSIYRFMPDPVLDGATLYEVSVPAGLEDVTGGILDETFDWQFTTLSPSVVSISPENRAQDVALTRPMTVTFNMPMDQSATEAAISLDPPAPVTVSWSDDSRQVTLELQDPLDLSTEYRLQVADSARSLGGQATLDRTTDSTFMTVLAPAVVETRPGPNQTADRFMRGVRIVFASPMDLTTLEDKIQIDPAPDSTNYYYNDYDFSLIIDFDTERNTDYVVTVPDSASDPYGNTLGENYTWRFTTPGYAPTVSLNLPGSISQLSTNLPSNVEVIHRNVSRLDAALYDAGLPADRLVSSRLFDYGPSSQPLQTWSIPLDAPPETADIYELPLSGGEVLPTGVYYLEISAPEIEEEHTYWQNQRSFLVVADTNLVVKENFESVHVWATDLATGEPASGRNLTLYDDLGVSIGDAVTDQDGLATFSFDPREDHLNGVLVVSNSPGEAGFGAASSQWNQSATPWSFGVEVGWSEEPLHFSYIYTDRPIYRPGDTVHFRGIVRDTDYGRYPLPSITTAAMKMFYLNEFEELDFTLEASIDENGEFSGEYIIPADARLGDYRLYFDDPQTEGDRIFTVAEYRAPEFQVITTPSEEQTLRGEPVEVLLEAGYFFGGPAVDLPVEWTVTTESFRLPWQGPYYSFSDAADFFSMPEGGPFALDRGLGRQQILSGQGMTDSAGRFTISLPADLLDEVDPGSQRVTVSANVRDVSEFPVAARSEVVFHDGEIYAGVSPASYIGQAGVESDINVISVDWDGQPVSERSVELTFYERTWTPVRDQRLNQYYTRWEAEDSEVAQQTVTTDDQGQITASFTPTSGGTYVVVATVADDAGRQQSSSTTMWVSDVDAVGWAVDPRDKKMDLVADKEQYRPGETAQILVKSPFDGPVNAWLTIERGDILEQRLITLVSSSEVVEILLSSEHAPNVFVTIHAVKGVDESNPYADMRIGLTELVVAPEQLALNVAITPHNDMLSPGGTAEYDLLVTDHQGNPVQANFSLALVDLAVLTLKADNAPHIVDAFYKRQPLRSQTGAGLMV